MAVVHRNYSGVVTPDDVGMEYINCNFTQPTAHTRLFPGDDTPRTFTHCNMKNCDLPPGSIVTGAAPRHWIRDVINDEVFTIMGVQTTIEAFKLEGT